MKVGEIVYKILGDDSGLAKTLDGAKDKISSAFSAGSQKASEAFDGIKGKISEALNAASKNAQEFEKKVIAAAKTAAKKLAEEIPDAAAKTAAALGTAVTAAAGAVATLTKAAVQSYANYEQLVGGVETLFGAGGQSIEKYAESVGKSVDEVKAEYDSLMAAQSTVMENAAKAFDTAGLSQNEYMETVTGFSAALISSLAGDTEKAAEIADMAIIDMADNMNKMGSTMESVQNAYQGFAKQNYTMLDNLKLGYGGTKEEMERLLADAEKLTGIKYDISSYADVVQAIHAIQEEMGINGTTADEAARTITGSCSAMRAAWDNLVVGLADDNQDFTVLLDNFVGKFKTALDNLAPRIETALGGISHAIGEIVPVISEMFPDIADEVLPSLIDSAKTLVEALLEALPELVETVIPELLDAVVDLIGTITDMLPQLLGTLSDVAIDVITVLVEAILEALPAVADSAVDIIIALVDGISDNLPQLIPAAVEAVLIIAEGLIDNLAEIVDAASKLVIALANGLTSEETVSKLLEKAPELVVNLCDALIDSVEVLIPAAVKFCTTIADNLVNHDWGDTAKKVTDNIANALDAAQKKVQVALDNLFSGGELYGGDVNNVRTTEWVDWYREGSKQVVQTIDEAAEDFANAYNNGMEVLNSNIEEASKGYDYKDADRRAQAVLDKYREQAAEFKKAQEEAGEDISAAAGETADGIEVGVETLESALENLEHQFKIHNITEEEYWAERKAILEKYRDEESEEWNAMYDKVTEHYDKLAETEKKAAEKAAKEAETALKNSVSDGLQKLQIKQLEEGLSDEWLYDEWEKLIADLDHNGEVYLDNYQKILEGRKKLKENAEKEEERARKQAESELKTTAADKFRDLETEQLEKGYDDSWLTEQKRSFIETLDHNSEVYKDYNLKLLQEQKKTDESAAKEAQKAAEKQQDALEKAYDSVIKSRDKLADSLRLDGDIFSETTETDKRTGETSTKRGVDLESLERKIAAKKKLTSAIAELLEKNTPDEIISELLKADPEAALEYANQLLKNPAKLSRLSADIKQDKAYSKIIADMVTENSEEYRQLGEDAGTVFGDGFMEALREQFGQEFDKIIGSLVDEEYAVKIAAANASVGEQSAAAVPVSSIQQETTAVQKRQSMSVPQSGNYTVRVTDMNWNYIATAVNAENDHTNIRSGG